MPHLFKDNHNLNLYHFSNMSSAIITKNLNKRITVDIVFHDNYEACIKLFRSIDKRYWDSVNKVWSFPNEALPTIIAGLEANGVDVVVNEYQPKVDILELEDILHVTARFNPNTYEIIKRLPDAVWDHHQKLWKVPLKDLSYLESEFNKQNIQFTISTNHYPRSPSPSQPSPTQLCLAPRKPFKSRINVGNASH
jgi:hypothetical protein